MFIDALVGVTIAAILVVLRAVEQLAVQFLEVHEPPTHFPDVRGWPVDGRAVALGVVSGVEGVADEEDVLEVLQAREAVDFLP